MERSQRVPAREWAAAQREERNAAERFDRTVWFVNLRDRQTAGNGCHDLCPEECMKVRARANSPTCIDRLPYSHTSSRIRCMKTKTTLILPENLMRELRRRAAQRGETLSEVVAAAIQKGLAESGPEKRIEPLPTYPMGEARVDLADRDRLYDLMDEE